MAFFEQPPQLTDYIIGKMKLTKREGDYDGFLAAKGVPGDFSFVKAQRGMFSYSGLTSAQVDRLRTEHGIYAVSTGRICVAALNTHNIDAVVNAIADVL